MELFSPAKLNLYFRVYNRRSDGYHEIASLISPVNFGDRLRFRLAESDHLTCTDPSLSLDQTNLVYRALSLFREKSGLNFSVQIDIEKRIPVGAGLGGGSSNAATTLWALNELTERPFSSLQLCEMGAEIGSDVPCFFSETASLCRGRGEVIASHPLPSFKQLFIAHPQGLSMSTPSVFSAVRLDELQAVPRTEPLDKETYYNDLELAAFRLAPSLKQLKLQLQGLPFDHVQMTGSGSAFYCVGDVDTPTLDGVVFTPVSPLNRREGEWWTG